jgi:ubiquinone/menaquinone biosynthesis C-methylase UbiE
MKKPPWYYDEIRQIGTDYENVEEVKSYDERMSKFRNFDEESLRISEQLELNSNHNLIEIGCGTGAFTISAAIICSSVTAVDVSPVMLEYAENKAKASACGNIKFMHGGFLSYEHSGLLFDSAVSQLSLHHLPDFWKMIALKRLSSILKPGAKFYLKDVVFTVDPEKYEKTISFSVENMRQKAGDVTARNFEKHISNEFSTFDWIMEEMIYRAGFELLSAEYDDLFIAEYVCRKI